MLLFQSRFVIILPDLRQNSLNVCLLLIVRLFFLCFFIAVYWHGNHEAGAFDCPVRPQVRLQLLKHWEQVLQLRVEQPIVIKETLPIVGVRGACTYQIRQVEGFRSYVGFYQFVEGWLDDAHLLGGEDASL